MTRDFEEADGRPPKKVREKLADAESVTGAEFVPPSDLNGYRDEPVLRFGLWVGDTPEDAELHTFEVTGDQIHGFADVFQRASDDAADIENDA